MRLAYKHNLLKGVHCILHLFAAADKAQPVVGTEMLN